MGLTDRLHAAGNAVTGAPWSFETRQETLMSPSEVSLLEEWMLKQPYAGLRAAHHIHMKVKDVTAASADLRKEGDWISLTCDNPIFGDSAVATTVFSLARERAATSNVYSFTSNTTDVLLGGENGINLSVPTAIDGTLAFNHGRKGSILLEVQANIPGGKYSRMANGYTAAKGLDPQIVTGEIVGNILVAFDKFRAPTTRR